MFPLSASECLGLAEVLGPRWRVVDGRRVDAADLVLLRPCSAPTTAAVRALFAAARLIVLDVAGDEATPTPGPVSRALEAGADVYLVEPGGRAA